MIYHDETWPGLVNSCLPAVHVKFPNWYPTLGVVPLPSWTNSSSLPPFKKRNTCFLHLFFTCSPLRGDSFANQPTVALLNHHWHSLHRALQCSVVPVPGVFVGWNNGAATCLLQKCRFSWSRSPGLHCEHITWKWNMESRLYKQWGHPLPLWVSRRVSAPILVSRCVMLCSQELARICCSCWNNCGGGGHKDAIAPDKGEFKQWGTDFSQLNDLFTTS